MILFFCLVFIGDALRVPLDIKSSTSASKLKGIMKATTSEKMLSNMCPFKICGSANWFLQFPECCSICGPHVMCAKREHKRERGHGRAKQIISSAESSSSTTSACLDFEDIDIVGSAATSLPDAITNEASFPDLTIFSSGTISYVDWTGETSSNVIAAHPSTDDANKYLVASTDYTGSKLLIVEVTLAWSTGQVTVALTYAKFDADAGVDPSQPSLTSQELNSMWNKNTNSILPRGNCGSTDSNCIISLQGLKMKICSLNSPAISTTAITSTTSLYTLYIDHALSSNGADIPDQEYTGTNDECKQLCTDNVSCKGFVDNREISPKVCKFKTTASGIYEKAGKDFYAKN